MPDIFIQITAAIIAAIVLAISATQLVYWPCKTRRCRERTSGNRLCYHSKLRFDLKRRKFIPRFRDKTRVTYLFHARGEEEIEAIRTLSGSIDFTMIQQNLMIYYNLDNPKDYYFHADAPTRKDSVQLGIAAALSIIIIAISITILRNIFFL